uniref:Uncharacterized protein n=1 Tax=Rhizophora mucronata TaxID=61149 RepID=A0A2P2Q5T0_RHIMU
MQVYEEKQIRSNKVKQVKDYLSPLLDLLD